MTKAPLQPKQAPAAAREPFAAPRLRSHSMAEPSPSRDHCACGGGCPRCQASPGKALDGPTRERFETTFSRHFSWVGGRAMAEQEGEAQLVGRQFSDFHQAASIDSPPRRRRVDFSEVQLHTDAEAGEQAKSMGANAFTFGRDVFFAPGRYSPAHPEGEGLLAHELAHVLQQRQGPRRIQRQTPGAAAAPGPGAMPAEFIAEARAFVQSATSFIDTIARINRLPARARTVFTTSSLETMLDGLKTRYEKADGILRGTVGGDAALQQALDTAYTDAVSAVISAASADLSSTTSTLYNQNLSRIHEIAWPRGVVDPNANQLSDALPESERRAIRVVTTNITLPNYTGYFAANASAVALPTGVTVRFAGAFPPTANPSPAGLAVRSRLEAGLTNIAATLAGISPGGLEVNSTITLALDLESVGADYSAFRFTYVRHPAGGGNPATSEILIERLGSVGVERIRPTQAQDQLRRFGQFNFQWGTGWTNAGDVNDSEVQSVLSAIQGIPDSLLTQGDWLTFRRASASTADPTRSGEYEIGSHTISLFDRAFSSSLTRLGMPGSLADGAVFTIRHEIGHAIDQRALRLAFATWQGSVSAHNAAVAQVNTARAAAFRETSPGSGRFVIPPGQQRRWNELGQPMQATQQALTAATTARDTARSHSGGRWTQTPGTTNFTVTSGPAGAGSNAFRQAAVADGGTRITRYSDTGWEEYFAESFALYMTDPDALRRLRPRVHAYFVATFP